MLESRPEQRIHEPDALTQLDTDRRGLRHAVDPGVFVEEEFPDRSSRRRLVSECHQVRGREDVSVAGGIELEARVPGADAREQDRSGRQGEAAAAAGALEGEHDRDAAGCGKKEREPGPPLIRLEHEDERDHEQEVELG